LPHRTCPIPKNLITTFILQRKKNPDLKGLRTRVWTCGHLRKDGKPINEAVADTLVCVLWQRLTSTI
jgi:hypothetical protein